MYINRHVIFGHFLGITENLGTNFFKKKFNTPFGETR